MKILFKLFFFLFLTYSAYSQSFEIPYCWPIDSSCSVSGNYGELRPNHFHAGLDFSTKGKINLPVYAVADGYVSRIRVNAAGYGKCVYVTHPNGKTSVYAHLNSFSKEISDLVRKEQLEKQSFEVEIFPEPHNYNIKMRDCLGFSGNTGSSSGPHLHFELRDAKTEVPLNPLFHYKVRDTVKPFIERVAFYNLADTNSPKFISSFRVKKLMNGLALEKKTVIVEEGILGLAFSGYDMIDYRGGRNNVYLAKVYLDEQLIYSHKLDHIHFDDHRFVNEFSEKIDGFYFQKCFIPMVYPEKMFAM